MMRRAAGLLLAVAVTLAVVAASRVPWDAGAGDEGRLRLSWRLLGEEVVACRARSAEELESLPVHMRNPEACEGRVTPYRLRLEVDGTVRADRLVRPAGARGDRPIFVLEELGLSPGTYRVEVSFAATDSAAGDPPLTLDTTVDIEPRAVSLVTLDDERRLVVRR